MMHHKVIIPLGQCKELVSKYGFKSKFNLNAPLNDVLLHFIRLQKQSPFSIKETNKKISSIHKHAIRLLEYLNQVPVPQDKIDSHVSKLKNCINSSPLMVTTLTLCGVDYEEIIEVLDNVSLGSIGTINKLIDATNKVLSESGQKGRTKNYNYNRLLHRLIKIYEGGTGRKAGITYSPIQNRYSGSFYGFIEACLAYLGPTEKKSNQALGKSLQRAMK